MPSYNNFQNGYYPPAMSYYPNTSAVQAALGQNMQQSQAPIQQNDTQFSWVQGRAGAEAYSLAPGRSAFLMDSNEPYLYAKATDSYGRYMPLQTYKLVPVEEPQALSTSANSEPVDYDKIRSIVSDEVTRQMDSMNKHNRKEGK